MGSGFVFRSKTRAGGQTARAELRLEPDLLLWAEMLRFTAYGVDGAVRVSHRALIPAVEAILPPGWEPTGAGTSPDVTFSLQMDEEDGATRVLVYVDTRRIAQTTELEAALRRLENAIDLRIALLAPRHLFIHAGAVLWRGRALILPGRSRSGKSTLIHALCERWADLLSDEFAVFDGDGNVHPYPRAIALRVGGSFRREVMPPHVANSGPHPPGLVAVVHYEATASVRHTPISRRAAMLHLLDNAVAARQRPEFSGMILTALTERVAAVSMTRGEAAEAAEYLLDILERETE